MSLRIRNRLMGRMGLVEGIMAGLFFGTAAIFIRSLNEIDPLSISFYRLFISSGIIFILFLFYRHERRIFIQSYFPRIIILGALIGLHFLTFTLAVKMTTIINATVLVNTTPVITMVFYLLLYRKKPLFISMIGLILSMFGIITISLTELSFSFSGLAGDLLALSAAVFWAAYLIVGKPVREKCDVLQIMPLIYFIGSITLLVISIFGTANQLVLPTLNQFIPLIGLSLLPTAIGHTLHFSSMNSLRPYQTSILALLEPITATLLAFLIFNELPAPPFFIGALLVVTGIYMIVRHEFS